MRSKRYLPPKKPSDTITLVINSINISNNNNVHLDHKQENFISTNANSNSSKNNEDVPSQGIFLDEETSQISDDPFPDAIHSKAKNLI